MSTKPMERFQLYISRDQRQTLEKLAQDSGQEMSELVREAIDRVYRTGRRVAEFDRALESTFGILKDRTGIHSGSQFQNRLRKRWDR